MSCKSVALLIVAIVCCACGSRKSVFDELICTQPDSVVVRPLWDAKVGGASRMYLGKEPSPETVSLPKAETAELVANLRRDDLAADRSGKACGMDPGIAVEFKRGEKQFIVLLCFTCSLFATVPRSASSEFGKDFYHLGTFVGWVKKAFPKEKAIQGIAQR